MTEIIKIRKALFMTRGIKKVQEEIVMESLEVPVDNLQDKVILEEVVRGVFKERREDNSLETEIVEETEILNLQPREEASVQK